MLDLKFTYADCVERSERVQWRLDDIMPEGSTLDFARPFLPQAMLASADASIASPATKLALNQICGNAYLNLFQFVEEYILATMLGHAQAELFGNSNAQRALSRMVDEELKHQLLFKRFRTAFDRGFGHRCGVLENAAEVAHLIMSHSPMAVMLITLHIEWMTQSHYTESVKGDQELDPFFKKLLHSHWLEESQHARIDLLELDKLARGTRAEARHTAVMEYLGIIEAFDGLLREQARMDVKSLRAIDASIDDVEIETAIHHAYQKMFLWYGMTNANVTRAIAALSPSISNHVAERACSYG